MEHIIKYLLNPLKTGVYHSQFVADFSLLKLFFSDLTEIAKKHKSRLWKPLKNYEPYDISFISDEYVAEEIFELLEDATLALKIYSFFDECPKEILRYLTADEQKEEIDSYYEKDEEIENLGQLIYLFGRDDAFESFILDSINDVIVIEPEKTYGPNELSFQITTVTEKGTRRFHDFLRSIPHIGDAIKEIYKRKTHSSRYAFRPYHLALGLWLQKEKAIAVPEDLRAFLDGSLTYYHENEWRTSIVLSAICVETVLADIYEEEIKEYAPNASLGELYHEVKSKITFPSHIARAIEMVNEARISAVHRSRFPVSEREAINALYGSTAFVIWYFSKG